MRVVFAIAAIGLITAEAVVYMAVGQAIGILPTLGLGLLSMVAGTVLLRRQGVRTIMRIRAEASAGRAPTAALLEGAVMAAAAILMILPGFLTDLLGLALFVPPVRQFLGRRLRRRVESWAAGRGAYRPEPAGVLDLDRQDYAFRSKPASPWRSDAP